MSQLLGSFNPAKHRRQSKRPTQPWPEPRLSEWNAAKKDNLEFTLYRMVCRNEISLKHAERVHGLRYETREEMKSMTFEYIEAPYNRKRQDSTLGYKSPIQFLDAWLIAQKEEKLVA